MADFSAVAVWQVLESPDFSKRDLSCVQTVAYGGAPAAPELVRRIQEHFPKATPGGSPATILSTRTPHTSSRRRWTAFRSCS